MKILVMGAGKMTEAILMGLENKMNMKDFHIFTPQGESARALSLKVGATYLSSLEDISGPDFILIGCKPQQLRDLASLLASKFSDVTFISMLAALSEKAQLNILNGKRLVRIMPNLPVRFNKGVTLVSSGSAKDQLDIVAKLFSQLGMSKIVTEEVLEELTLLTGSGPAFFYEFTKLLSSSFRSLDQASREELARMVLTGSGLAVANDKESLDGMLNSVTSKAGVTIAVLEQWRKSQMSELIEKGIETGKIRSSEIASTIGQK